MFRLIDHIHLLDVQERKNSYVKAVCPVCQGIIKFNTNTHSSYYGAYSCYSQGCSSKDIRKALGLVEDNPYDFYVSSTPNEFIPSPIDIQKPVILCKVTNYAKPKQYSFFSIDYQNNINLTYYKYTDKVRVKRIDTPDEKIPVFEIFVDGQWVSKDTAKYMDLYPLYTNGTDLSTGNTVFMAEGEKTTDYLCSLGLPCFTPCVIGFNVDYLSLTLQSYYARHIKNVYYFPDNDLAGERKAKIVLHACWNSGIGAKSISLNELFPTKELFKGMDLADIDKEELLCNLNGYF
jgi:hypothetical protein